MHHIRFLLFGGEVASRIFGPAGVHPGQDFSKLGIGVELLQLRAQAGVFGRVWEMFLISNFGDLGLDAVCVLSCSFLLVGCSARLNARVEPGALNAGGLGYLVAERLMDLNSV